MKPVYLLARVSTLKKSQDASPERQLENLRAYCVRQEWPVEGEAVERVSGAKGEAARPELARIMALARRGKIGAICVTRLDRLGRSLAHLLAVAEELRRLGVDLVILDLGLDTSTPIGRAVFAILGAMAELQRDLYAEAAQQGKARALAAGKHCARPREPIPEGTVDAATRMRRAYPGLSWRAVSAALGRLPTHRQPGRVIKSTGIVRPSRPWPPTSLRRAVEAAYMRRSPNHKPPGKTPPQDGENRPTSEPAAEPPQEPTSGGKDL